MATFFEKCETRFSPPGADGTIMSDPFLKASKQIVPFFDVLGKAFKPVKSDIDGNVTRLLKRYNSDPKKFETLRAILDDEVSRKCSKDKNSATQGLLWYKRALEYIMLFLRYIAEDHQAGTKTENLGAFARKAYDETLKKYHGWFVQTIFNVVSRAIPWRKDLLKSLGSSDCSEDKVIEDMVEYIQEVEVNVQVIQAMLTEMNLDFQDKV